MQFSSAWRRMLADTRGRAGGSSLVVCSSRTRCIASRRARRVFMRLLNVARPRRSRRGSSFSIIIPARRSRADWLISPLATETCRRRPRDRPLTRRSSPSCSYPSPIIGHYARVDTRPLRYEVAENAGREWNEFIELRCIKTYNYMHRNL